MVKLREFDCGDGGPPGKTFDDCRFEVVEVALMEGGCFARLDRSKDRCGIGPVCGVESVEDCVLGLKAG